MKKASAILLFLFAFTFALAGSLLANGQTHRVFLNASGWIRIYNAGGLVTDCGGYAGTTQYFAKISTPTETVAYLMGAAKPTTWSTGAQIVPVDFSDWYNGNDELGGISPGTGGLFLTEVTAATDAFAWCDYQEAD